jgi:hypothetical protein
LSVGQQQRHAAADAGDTGVARGVERFEICIFKLEVLRVVSVPSAPAVVIKPVAGHSAEG